MVVACAALLLGGCAFWPAPPTQTHQPVAVTRGEAAPQSISTEATTALQTARQRVMEARAARMLWRSALSKLEEAEVAAAKFDSSVTLRAARETVALCDKSQAQALSPPIVW